MELHVWDGEAKYGLPSMDLKSLQMLAYVKFSGAPVTIVKSSNPFKSPTGQLPVFKCIEGAFSDFSQVTTFLRKQNFSCDYELSAKQCSEVVAYEHLLLEKLYPALMYLWWVEPKSYCDVIHKWYFSSIPFPYKLWYPRRYHIGQCDLINSMFDDPDDSQLIETELHKQAQECLTMLSNRLGDREYFFGRSPSTIDALVFSYLAILLKVDLKVPVLQNHIKACPNLSRYVSKAIQRFFPAEGHRGTEARDSPAKDDVPNKGRNLLLSGLVAFSAMFGYAIAAGLVQVDMGEPPVEEEYDYEYEDYNDAGSSGN
ncbi:metaxin-1-like isoform X2 [Homarus americanus]|uniref:metaxin-1-like isoform X2 n=1 Tax=Homarus americanus TaxID=6706 RepID=UPI001C44B3C1|nr:metaxin-1-like isoform X2 [Homarus americanus]